MISFLMMILLFITTGISSGPRPDSKPRPNTETDIKKVDFLNFTYSSSLCSQEFGNKGIGKTVRVTKGEFKNKSVYFAVDQDKVTYGDLNGDGSDEAVVPISCGAISANFSRSEVHVFTIKDGRTTLLGALNDKSFERDYRRSYPEAESYWGGTEKGPKVNNGNLEIEVLTDGSHAAPKYVALLEYHLTGGSFSLISKPQRKNA
jgi:hypothetical protein